VQEKVFVKDFGGNAKKINHEFWSLSHFQRRCFMLNATKRKLTSRNTVASNSKRKHSYYYFLRGSDANKSVCKTFFLTTLGFQKNNDTALQTCLKSTAIDSITLTEEVQHPLQQQLIAQKLKHTLKRLIRLCRTIEGNMLLKDDICHPTLQLRRCMMISLVSTTLSVRTRFTDKWCKT